MKHASPAALEALSPLLEKLRRVAGLVEKSPGVFYLRSRAFLHFHEDPAGLFADAKLDLADFQRFRVSTSIEQAALLRAVTETLRRSPGVGKANGR